MTDKYRMVIESMEGYLQKESPEIGFKIYNNKFKTLIKSYKTLEENEIILSLSILNLITALISKFNQYKIEDSVMEEILNKAFEEIKVLLLTEVDPLYVRENPSILFNKVYRIQKEIIKTEEACLKWEKIQ